MNITNIRVSLGGTANTGDYENVKFDVQMDAELAADEDPIEAAQQLFETIRQLVISQALTVRGTDRFVSRLRSKTIDHEAVGEVPF